MKEEATTHQLIIVGGGFAGLYAAKALARAPVQVTLIDRRNFHLFQPLLYQVATGGVSPGEIASALRSVLSRQKNTQVMAAEVVDLEPSAKQLRLRDGRSLHYDSLVVATGADYHYFGRDEEWASLAPGLKTLEDALTIRRRIFHAFEAAEWESDPARRQALLTFVIVGGGPTGVELAGALGELAQYTLRHDFRHINPADARILLLEGTERILGEYPAHLSARAAADLERLGVTVLTGTLLKEVQSESVVVRRNSAEDGNGAEDDGAVAANDTEERLPACTVLWAAGVRASSFGRVVAERTGAQTDRLGRMKVESDLTIAGFPDIAVVGDLAHVVGHDGAPLPGIAPVAMQQGAYAARWVQSRLHGRGLPPFRYRDKGKLAVIGRNAAVADLGYLQIGGFPAWLLWVFVHIAYLIEFENKILVLIQWAWSYITRGRGARLIVGPEAE
jgi:NADH:ubiquinone reductase (H+-translocating)